MHEIDLIPADYRAARRERRGLVIAASVVLLLLAGTVLARIAIEAGIARERPVVQRLQRDTSQRAGLRSELARLNEQRLRLDARVATLAILRRPAPWHAALDSVDQAFASGLWLDQLSFVQAPRPLTTALPAAKPASAATPAHAETDTASLLEIHAHALDHAGVMAFLERLRAVPTLRQVRLADTSVRRYASGEVIDFSVTAVVVASPEAAPAQATTAPQGRGQP